ncbi:MULTISPECIES: hypothetical protein [Mycobacteriaceae]|jgi:hypothetical protein|uniref:hypothetical protein n=1 Tax=Mycolicibacterium goodii TaxID=134601 RepID=UPI001BDC807D|nr:hypothetical protein [Mycolicibacterium goodii]MBU8813189.1 hypothetical protein [Mycolicibacterium goodii]
MRTIIGVAIGTIVFWLAMLATAVTYILEHIFAIGLATVLVMAAVLASRRRCGARPPLHTSSPSPRRHRPVTLKAGRLAGAHPAPTAHMRKVV